MVVLLVLGILLALGVIGAVAATLRAVVLDGHAAAPRIAGYDSRHPTR
jgi:hypothetical protein